MKRKMVLRIDRERAVTLVLLAIGLGMAAVVFWPKVTPWWSIREGWVLHRAVAAAAADDGQAWAELAAPAATGARSQVGAAARGYVRAWYQPEGEPGRFMALVSNLPDREAVLLHFTTEGRRWVVTGVEVPRENQPVWWMQEPYASRWKRLGL